MTSWPAWAVEQVEVRPADDGWQRAGEDERRGLDAILGAWLVGPVEHIGSTAVPGLPAKPILDLQAPVAALNCDSSIAAELAPLGWAYVPPELDGRQWRRFFVKVEEGRRVAHLHVMSASHPRWSEQLTFRDALRADPGLAQRYSAVKRALAARYHDDREAYTAAKGDFVSAVLRGRGADGSAP